MLISKRFIFANAFLLFLAVCSPKTELFSQELRLHGSMQVLGEIEGGFTGVGIGLETPINNHLALNADINFGTQSIGSVVAIKPALLYYFKNNQRGFFIGPSFKYMSLKEKNDGRRYDDSLYAIGFSFGVKTHLKGRTSFMLMLNPHKTIGGSNEADVAGISGQIGFGFRL